MARNITVIPARASRQSTAERLEPQKKRMAAYCRVSTDQLEQLSSYEAQVAYYTTYITIIQIMNSEEFTQMKGFQEQALKRENSSIK